VISGSGVGVGVGGEGGLLPPELPQPKSKKDVDKINRTFFVL
jgi:hypothetical protein